MSNLRVMWLINHTSARKFETSILKRAGIDQIYLPKIYPQLPSFRSASVDYSEDANLKITPDELEKLNATDWYDEVDAETWQIANKHFDVIFIILFNASAMESALRNFNGAIIWRAYGLQKPLTHTLLAKHLNITKQIRDAGKRFYFGEAYPHLADQESELIKERRLYLPLGLSQSKNLKKWEGKEKKIYFVCPDIITNDYYNKIYSKFILDFSDFDYIIAGAQSIKHADERVIGYVDSETHSYNMTQSRVMFYHSQEPNHIHYHPFEAMRLGMPVIFMAGSMLDQMGGANLPGRCKSITEARKKIARTLEGDWKLIEAIRSSQSIILEYMDPEKCLPTWQSAMKRISNELFASRQEAALKPHKDLTKKIAVLLPVPYRGGSLRGALALANALFIGSAQDKQATEIIFVHPDDPDSYSPENLDDLHRNIKRRSFNWKLLSAPEARRAMYFAGHRDWEPQSDSYMVPDDNIRQLQDCDLWLIISDRLNSPILPIKPVVMVVYDYIQRYINIFNSPASDGLPFIENARSANKILVTTEFTESDAVQYAGVSPNKVVNLPMLSPEFWKHSDSSSYSKNKNYKHFIWTTNAAPHKNHLNTLKALKIYYEELDGKLNCVITGVNSELIKSGNDENSIKILNLLNKSPTLTKKTKWLGELNDNDYIKKLAKSAFLIHTAKIDNGTFSVIEAASLGVPALSSLYPPMQEINNQFSLNLSWMDPNSPRDMAEKIKELELTHLKLREMLPDVNTLKMQSIEVHAKAYWQEIKKCL